jgi:protocatechuate 3,4-dioxygenase beta subunit
VIVWILLALTLNAQEQGEGAIEVLLRFEDGTPALDAYVMALPGLAQAHGEGPSVESSYEGQPAGDGRYRIEALPPGKGWRVYASLGAFVPCASAVFALSKKELKTIELRVERGASVSGSVTDVEGRAIEGALVSVQRHRPWFFHYEHRDSRLDRTFEPRREVATDARGAFALAGLDLGGWELDVRHPLYCRERRVLAFARDESKTGFPFVLQRGEVVRGIVRSASGAPIPGAEIEWKSSSDASIRQEISGIGTRSDRDGRFEFACLRRGRRDVESRAELEASASGFGRASLYVAMPSREALEIVLEANPEESGEELPIVEEPDLEFEPLAERLAPASCGSIAGTVRTRDGRPLEDGLVLVNSGDRRWSRARTDANGRYRIDLLPPGDGHVLFVIPPTMPELDAAWDACEMEERQRVVAGETTICDWVAPEAALRHLRVDLRRGTGELLTAGVVYLLPRHPNENFEIGAEGRVALIDADGRIEVRDLLPGLYYLAVWVTGRRPVVSYAVDLPFAESDAASRELVLPSTVVHGVVRDVNGSLVEGARVQVRAIPKRTRPTLGRSSMLGELQEAWSAGRITDRAGRFRLEGWAPGRYALQVFRDPQLYGDGIGSIASTSFELRDAQSSVELSLQARPPLLLSMRILDGETQAPHPEAYGVAEHVSSGWRVGLYPLEDGVLEFQEHRGSELDVHLFARDRVPRTVRLRFDDEEKPSRTVALQAGASMCFHSRSATGTAMASCRLEVERAPALDSVLRWLEDFEGSQLAFWPSLSDAEGVLVRRDLPAGRCRVRFTRGSQASEWTEIEVPERGERVVELRLR